MNLIVKLAIAVLLSNSSVLAPSIVLAEVNEAGKSAEANHAFEIATVAQFDTPWAIAVLADGKMLITEKRGQLFLVTPDGKKTEVKGVPAVHYSGQNGLLDIVLAPSFARDGTVYVSYVAPSAGGGTLALARAKLADVESAPKLENLSVIWQATPNGGGGQPGGIITFSPDGRHLFLSSGDRMQPETAQDMQTSLGKIIRLNLDGSVPADNPFAAKGGVQAQIWSYGHRNPYGLAFAPDGQLWETEMGPRGGDELNRITQGENYGWPLVSDGDNYDGTPIPRHSTQPDLTAPVLYWTPSIAPAGLAFYSGSLFANWQGSALMGALRGEALIRVAFDGESGASQVERWNMGARIRAIAVAPDGAVWLIEDAANGRLMRLTPKP